MFLDIFITSLLFCTKYYFYTKQYRSSVILKYKREYNSIYIVYIKHFYCDIAEVYGIIYKAKSFIMVINEKSYCDIGEVENIS